MEVLRIWVKNLEIKKEIRKEILEKRRACDKSLALEWTACIEKMVYAHPFFEKAENLCTYMSFDGEVGTDGIIRRAFELGKRVWIPKISRKTMEFYELTKREHLVRNSYGILEPSGEGMSFKDQNLEKSLMIMPGVAFDRHRNRIGYGGGYYDRYLEERKELRTIAVAFELQVVEELPTESTDIRPDVLITEMRSY